MLRITQTNTSPHEGNCLQAAVASLLDLALDEVPHFILSPDWEIRFMDFMADSGRPVTLTGYTGMESGIAVGPTVRATHHAVVMEHGSLAWDPHPSRAGLLAVSHVYAV
jgi:hypothetical protein